MLLWYSLAGKLADFMRGSATSLECGTVHNGEPVADPFVLVTRNTDPEADHVRPIGLLRQYARYLAPQAGLFAADTRTIASTWLRNTLLNLLILITFLGAALLTPRIATFVLLHLHAFVPWLSQGWDSLGAAVRGGLLWAGCVLIGKYKLATFGLQRDKLKSRTRGDDDSQVFRRILSRSLCWGHSSKSP